MTVYYCICTGDWLERFNNAREYYVDDFPPQDYENPIYQDEDYWYNRERHWNDCFMDFSFLNFKEQDTAEFQCIISLLEELYYSKDCRDRFKGWSNLVSDLAVRMSGYEDPPYGDYEFVRRIDWSTSFLGWDNYIIALPCKLVAFSERAKWVIETMRDKGEKDNLIVRQLKSMDFAERIEWEWQFDKEEFLRDIERQEDIIEDEAYRKQQKVINEWANYYAKYIE